VAPEPPVAPAPPVDPDPMCGQGFLPEGAGRCPGAGAGGVDVVGGLDWVLDGAFSVAGAAAAPAMPATAPPVARAPAARAAASSLDLVIW
jgi:hypothetical protein